MLGFPDNFWGIIYDTASISSMHAIAAAREQLAELKFRGKGMSGRKERKGKKEQPERIVALAARA